MYLSLWSCGSEDPRMWWWVTERGGRRCGIGSRDGFFFLGGDVTEQLLYWVRIYGAESGFHTGGKCTRRPWHETGICIVIVFVLTEAFPSRAEIRSHSSSNLEILLFAPIGHSRKVSITGTEHYRPPRKKKTATPQTTPEGHLYSGIALYDRLTARVNGVHRCASPSCLRREIPTRSRGSSEVEPSPRREQFCRSSWTGKYGSRDSWFYEAAIRKAEIIW